MTEYESMGLDMSLRQLYYQMVTENLIANSEVEYKRLGTIVSDARMAGRLDWDMIKDRGRVPNIPNTWTGPRQILQAAADGFRLNMWVNQPTYVEVMVEKAALEGVFVPVCRELGVPFTANKGYTSSSAIRECAERITSECISDNWIDRRGKPKSAVVIYFGDHDPSGLDMSRDVNDRLQLLIGTGRNAWRPDGEYEGSWLEDFDLEVKRVALNIDQVREYAIPPNPAKMDDSRAKEYVKKFGSESWELDALRVNVLADLAREAIRDEISNQEAWDEDAAKQAQYRADLLEFASRYE